MNCLPYNSASWLGTWGWIAGSCQTPKNTLVELVGVFNPSEKYSSVGMITPNIWKVIKFHGSKPPSSELGHKIIKNIRKRGMSPGQFGPKFGPKFGPPNCQLHLISSMLLLWIWWSAQNDSAAWRGFWRDAHAVDSSRSTPTPTSRMFGKLIYFHCNPNCPMCSIATNSSVSTMFFNLVQFPTKFVNKVAN